jgi:hypothetical protein
LRFATLLFLGATMSVVLALTVPNAFVDPAQFLTDVMASPKRDTFCCAAQNALNPPAHLVADYRDN